MQRHHLRIPLLIVILLSMGVVLAQESTPDPTPEVTGEATAEVTAETTSEANSCPRIVDTAVNLTEQRCDGTNLNQACYGHIFLDAQPRAQSTGFNFSTPGDIVDLVSVESLQLSAMDVTTGQWGVMLMEVEANVDGEIRQEDVQLLLFGDTRLEDASEFVSLTALDTVNIRTEPTTNSDIVSSLPAGETIIANARLDDGAWLRVRYSDAADGIGWIAAEFVEANSDLSRLPALDPDNLPAPEDDLSARYGPMQAVFYESGGQDAPCAEAPNSGLLIQTPEGVASVTLWLDEVVIQLEGSGFVQAEANGDMTVNVLEGSAQVESRGDSRTAVTGTAITVPLDENARANDVPSAPQPIDPDDVQALPVDALDDPVSVPNPATLREGEPLAGQWRFTWSVDQRTCDNGENVPFESAGGSTVLQVQEDSLTYGGIRYNETNTGVYRTTYTDGEGSLHQNTLQVVGADRIDGEAIIDLADPICTLTVPFRLQLVSAE